MFACEENHDPDLYEGREWDQLSDAEREDAIHEWVLVGGDLR